jgi:hypothetical protein
MIERDWLPMKATLLAFTALLATAQLTSASTVTLDFEGLPSMDFHSGAPIPAAAQLRRNT